VVHHGKHGWTAPTEMHEIIDLEADMLGWVRELVPGFRFVLDDLVQVDEEALMARSMTAMVRAALLLFRNARRRKPEDLRSDLEHWVDAFGELVSSPNGRAAFWTLMRYVLQVNKMPVREVEAFAGLLGPAAVEAVMTGAEQLEQAGVIRGRAELLIRLLTKRFGPLSSEVERRVKQAAPEDLDGMADRVLFAASLDEVLQ
jgi:hypothetical protein